MSVGEQPLGRWCWGSAVPPQGALQGAGARRLPKHGHGVRFLSAGTTSGAQPCRDSNPCRSQVRVGRNVTNHRAAGRVVLAVEGRGPHTRTRLLSGRPVFLAPSGPFPPPAPLFAPFGAGLTPGAERSSFKTKFLNQARARCVPSTLHRMCLLGIIFQSAHLPCILWTPGGQEPCLVPCLSSTWYWTREPWISQDGEMLNSKGLFVQVDSPKFTAP